MKPQVPLGHLQPKDTSDPNNIPPEIYGNKNPKELFELFWPEEFFEYVKDQSELYARQCNATNKYEISMNELKLFFAVLMISGYSSLPRREMYWSLDLDIRNEAVAQAMSRNRFRDLLKNLHFVDNT